MHTQSRRGSSCKSISETHRSDKSYNVSGNPLYGFKNKNIGLQGRRSEAFFNVSQRRRNFTSLNQVFCGKTAYLMNHQPISQSSTCLPLNISFRLIDFYSFYLQKRCFIGEVTNNCATGRIKFTALPILFLWYP